ncbi:MAG TPA: hypothetical protein VNO52_01495 [Methylomirabilota bacterium]|nr:hypothetical protein [Methylomirabilota bacterium]
MMTKILRWFSVGLLLLGGDAARAEAGDLKGFGPALHEFKLTLKAGRRVEAAGPLFYREESGDVSTWAISPLLSYARDVGVDSTEMDLLYPVITFDRYGEEYRIQLLQWLSWSGGRALKDANVHRFTVFPFYFRQRSDLPERNYVALFPLFGRVENRFFRSEVEWVVWPIYVKTRRGVRANFAESDDFRSPARRNIEMRGVGRSGVTTYNYLLPFFHVREADGLQGWQFWPLVGHERKIVTAHTNSWGEVETIPGHTKSFLFWPVAFKQETGIGSDNESRFRAVLPFYSSLRSPQRDSTAYLYPLGVTVTDDRVRGYHEVGAPWPLVVFANGEGKTTRRIWPFYSRASNTNLETGWFLWPLYTYNRLHADPLERERTRVLFFLYSDTREKNTATGGERRRREMWPLFQHRRDPEGRERLQILSPLEPFAPTSRSIERNYSQVWSLWRSEADPRIGARSASLLWNLYRRDETPETKKLSLLFGLFQYESGPDSRRWRLFYLPAGSSRHNPPAASGP